MAIASYSAAALNKIFCFFLLPSKMNSETKRPDLKALIKSFKNQERCLVWHHFEDGYAPKTKKSTTYAKTFLDPPMAKIVSVSIFLSNNIP